jgi:cell wall-associated NlpC family hydrolase
MTVSDVTSRIAQIQSQLALLAPRQVGAPAFTLPATTGTTGATGTTGTTDAIGGTVGDPGTTYPTDPVAGGTGGPTATDVVDEARKYLGVPYLWGGTDPRRGMDCSGLVQLVYGNLGVDLPRVSYEQAKAGRPVANLAAAQPGDLLAFGSPVHHIAIYIGNGKMIEAPRPGLDVRVSSVYETPTAIRRVLPEGVSATAGRVSGVPFSDLFNAAGARYGVSPELLAAVARQESGFRPDALSPAGARGLMQLMPATAQGLGVTDPFDPAQAVDGAARLLDTLLERFGRTDLALAAYNAGPGAVLRYDGIPPYPETQNYVRSIMAMLGGTG